MATPRAEVLPSSDVEIVVTRVIEAPRELVFEAFTRPEHVVRWWGPDGWTITNDDMDVRPGGVWRYTMLGPNGEVVPNRITYVEVDPPERLVFDLGSDEDGAGFRTTVTFTQAGSLTRILFSSVFPSAQAREYVAREFHAVEGATQTLDKLGAYIIDLTQSRSTTS